MTRLPHYLHEHSKVLIQTPIRIVLIIIVALIVRAILHRLINRMTRPVRAGALPRLLRPLREKVDTTALLESAGLLSERRTQRAATVASVLRSFVSFTVFVLAALMILGELDVNLLPLVAGTSIVGVALGFGAQNIVKDFLAGMFMMLEDQYGVGDKSQGYAQVVLDVPISASVDIDAASAALREVADEMHAEDEWASVFIGEPDVQGVESITRYETVLRLVVRVRPLEQWRTARELRRRIRDRLERLDIEAGEPQEPPSS